jgi:hypothetical protein
MPRHRPGLGQGLEALVSPYRPEQPADPAEISRLPEPAPTFAVAWEYAVLSPRKPPRRRRRKDCRVTLLSADLLRKPRRRTLRGITPLVALGVLGASGWELVALRGRAYILKRPACTGASRAGLPARNLA